ncbi:MAG: tetratricopeptide repeat protein [Candidatus Omnitrophica bacterium]|nr:tetratricopeptide repeat protein [Candidatus Omnitrophota bacterium]
MSVTIAFSFAEEGNDQNYIFYKANVLYEKRDYDGALLEYQELLDANLTSGNLYYNMGNCYFKKGEMGKAILFYERARRLLPRDGDISSNYDYARSLIKETVLPTQKMWFLRFIDSFFKHFTINELTLLLSFLYLVFFCTLSAMIIFKMEKRFVIPVLCIILMMASTGLFSLIGKITYEGHGIVVINEKTIARFEPFERGTTHFTLFEGMKATIIQSKGMWYKIQREDRRLGWIEKKDVAII